MKQCKSCPWRKDVVPERDIPGGYCVKLHHDLRGTIAAPHAEDQPLGGPVRRMACHKSSPDRPYTCAGWAANQLGPGNNIMLRLRAVHDPDLRNIELRGEQHETFEDTLPT